MLCQRKNPGARIGMLHNTRFQQAPCNPLQGLTRLEHVNQAQTNEIGDTRFDRQLATSSHAPLAHTLAVTVPRFSTGYISPGWHQVFSLQQQA